MNFEKKKTVIFMILFTPYWAGGIKKYITKTISEAKKQAMIKHNHCKGMFSLLTVKTTAFTDKP